MIVLPDTQKYVLNGSPHFLDQTQWIAETAAERNIRFVIHVGDLVESGASSEVQWDRATEAMDVLAAADVPFSTVIGNHDYDSVVYSTSLRGSANAYLSRFGPHTPYFQGKAWFGGTSDNNLNTYCTFEAAGREILVLNLELDVPTAALEWAQGVLKTHPTMPTIISTHAYVKESGIPNKAYTRNSDNSTAERIRDELVLAYPQVFMAVNGHWHSPEKDENLIVDSNAVGRDVYQMLVNYQERSNGGEGYLRILTFDEDNNQIRAETYSPTLDSFERDSDSEFTIPFNFASRFDDISPAPAKIRFGFRQNANAYVGAQDTYIGNSSTESTLPTANLSRSPVLRVDGDEDSEQALIRFDDLFGNGPGQVDPGTVFRATLSICTGAASPTMTGASLHRLLVDWSDTDSWDSLVDGVVADGTEAAKTPELRTGSVDVGTRHFDVSRLTRGWRAKATLDGFYSEMGRMVGSWARRSQWKRTSARC
ncbi:metallophosphoesterase [Aeoliella sp.]|uniref:metallophosphoesterase n=1 Tax=Aeoliella sp. TaxID=2795800 RepID=UPI003CCC24B0